MNSAQLTKSLKSEAESLGFDFSGVCAAVEPQGFGRLRAWLDSGYDGEMHYVKGRLDAYQHPEHVMEGVQSIVMLGMNYRTVAPVVNQPGTGRLARYSWGVDYHDLIHGKLKLLCRKTAEVFPDINVRGVVDTAPLLEREFAQLAGLGWHAKNTMLINRDHGSWFLLAALLVDQPLVSDQPMETGHCGTCTACLDACPTNAFPEPGILDGTKCISYLTIEHRSPVPMELRPQMGQWLLGCDICQDVCPWNNKASETAKTEFQPKAESNPVELLPLFDLDDEQFRSRFRKTPLWRPRRRGILRNAAIVLGNHPCENALRALENGLGDEEPLIRGACAWAIARQKDKKAARAALVSRREVEQDDTVLTEIENALQFSGQ